MDKFKHIPIYDEENGIAISFLESKEEQTVHISEINQSFGFQKNEKIHTEISRKYDLKIINEIAQNTGLIINDTFYDSRKYFIDVLFEKEE